MTKCNCRWTVNAQQRNQQSSARQVLQPVEADSSSSGGEGRPEAATPVFEAKDGVELKDILIGRGALAKDVWRVAAIADVVGVFEQLMTDRGHEARQRAAGGWFLGHNSFGSR